MNQCVKHTISMAILSISGNGALVGANVCGLAVGESLIGEHEVGFKVLGEHVGSTLTGECVSGE